MKHPLSTRPHACIICSAFLEASLRDTDPGCMATMKDMIFMVSVRKRRRLQVAKTHNQDRDNERAYKTAVHGRWQ